MALKKPRATLLAAIVVGKRCLRLLTTTKMELGRYSAVNLSVIGAGIVTFILLGHKVTDRKD